MSSAPVYALRNVKTIILVSFTVGLNVVRRVELLCRGHSTSGPDSTLCIHQPCVYVRIYVIFLGKALQSNTM